MEGRIILDIVNSVGSFKKRQIVDYDYMKGSAYAEIVTSAAIWYTHIYPIMVINNYTVMSMMGYTWLYLFVYIVWDDY